MKVLIEGSNLQYYLAKCHESFRTGLRNLFDAKCYGKGYPGYDENIKTYEQIIRHVFSNSKPDIIVAYGYDIINSDWVFWHRGLERINIPKAMFLCDFWSEAECRLNTYIKMIERNRINFILSFFPQPLDMWKNTILKDKLIYMPPSFDPTIFKDWKMEKTYDVGFLAQGTASPDGFYPERWAIHQKVLQEKNIKYLWAQHPGWGYHEKGHPLVGDNFSKSINSCKIFITSGGIYRNPQPKIFEVLASKTLLMSDEPNGAQLIGLIDGVNYVKINTENVVEKIRHYLSHEEELNKIAENGYQLANTRHSCNCRAKDFYDAICKRINIGK